MSKLEDYLVTQAGTSTAGGGSVPNSTIGNFPALGDIVLSPNEKFADVDGKKQYDLPLADGSHVDVVLHPEYLSSIKYTNDVSGIPQVTTTLSSALRGGVGWEGFIHYDESRETWAVKYGVSWNRGVGQCPSELFATNYGSSTPAGTTGDGILREIPISFARSIFKVYTYALQLSGYSAEATLLMKSKGEDALLIETYSGFTTGYIRVTEGSNTPYEVDRSSENSAVVTFSVDYDTGVVQLTGQMEQVLSIDYRTVDQIFVGTKSTTAAVSGNRTSLGFVSQNTAYMPDIASPDTTCPYRVVVDLTGEQYE